MTQVGHTLTGIAIGVACLPDKKSTTSRLIHLVVFGLLANIPDLPLKNWGHDLYYFSHSLFVNLLLILIVLSAFILLKDIRARVGGWVVIIGGTLAWLSHLLLDTFYNHGKGLLMFWPLSDQRLALPIAWFSAVRDTSLPLKPETIHILLVEFAFYGPVLMAIILMKKAGIFNWITRHIS
jgi:LexA-binding, inner membrane-associated putative hydrolase